MNAIKLAFSPRKESAALVAQQNNFIAAFHQKRWNDWLVRVGENALQSEPAPLAFRADFIFAEAEELSIVCDRLPFLNLIEEWSKPWHWGELSQSLAFSLLEEACHHYKTKLPSSLRLINFSQKPLEAGQSTLKAQMIKGNTSYAIAMATKENFPFDKLAADLGLENIATYPKHLWLDLPLRLGSTQLAAAEIKTLGKGDIILIQPPSL